ncbi:MAG: anthranilate synthase component I family protein [Spirochaetes bacterium]|nr:anthranilate synthase component I family protein [Spirochaetota bacterium]MBN2770322.1 anthranilate synthase component I family protein [Spirochaetota bacterium]
MHYPDFNEYQKLSKQYNRIPVYRELNLEEPGHLLILKVMSEAGDVMFLESLGDNSDNTRFSFMGINPRHHYRFESGQMYKDNVHTGSFPDDKVFGYLKKEIDRYTSPAFEQFGHFNGGLAGYFGYEMVNYCGILRKPVRENNKIPQIYLMHIDEFICFDNETKKYYLSVCVYPEDGVQKSYYNALARLEELEEEIINKISETTLPYMPSRAEEVEPRFTESKTNFMSTVAKAVSMIDEGEALQIVLSMRAMIPEDIDPYRFYLRLRKTNPSPYMYFIKVNGIVIVGSSPEVHVRCSGREAMLRPIAGTAKRTGDEKADKLATEAMLADEKECAEHLMLVDLARNDLSRIAIPESVKVTRFMQPENYSHVIHLVSDVESVLDDDKHMIDVLKESFPAGTVSGAPKVRAIEIIDECETQPRDIYSGAIGYMGFNQYLDTCITIRTAYFTKEGNYLQAGAGIVQDSKPENEYQEIRNKLGALASSLAYAMPRKV